ncbi:stage II sporulation protein M [Mucilaginibacter terrigena]|uniref:Stage II sporulation protein M n=1 Tax=Mucilaginibacter terrigena TaxID=2492395 RepID=A0A4Q5LGQ3_9SPHI|nr:stage II sporulation protein M [Mucilaginibacter terrigena]RYU86150.1 stage II sporulation protein M [Mucilaginibacter terrigena]
MREALFVKQNNTRWTEYKNTTTKNPDELADRFIAITDDLAYAKTFYPESKTTAYLNKLAAGFHHTIYKNRKENNNRFLLFWKFELPLIFKRYHKEILWSFFFFMTFFFVGMISAKYDDTFVRLIMGDSYIDMTSANIAKGDPFGVYKDKSTFWMLYGIASNNLYITVVTYVTGLFFSLGTVFILFKNGIMLGAFEYFFISKGLGLQSVLVVFIHGTLEISAIIIAGGAGLVLGNSILFPKTYTRMVSMMKGAKDGIKIIVGILPIVVVAAIFESFLTRHTEMPAWLSIFILTASFCFIVWYVVIYPIYLSKKLNYNN